MEIKRGFINKKVWPWQEKQITQMFLSGKFTQTEIGKKFGLSQGHVSKIILKVTNKKDRHE